MEAVPRKEFVPVELKASARDDRALPVACGQSISQPSVVAYMTEKLCLRPSSRVLEVGTGTGYQAAVLAELSRSVFSIERVPELAEAARERLDRLGYERIQLRVGDGTLGWPEQAPFDAIIVTAAADEIPEALPQQLVTGGRLIAPVGPEDGAQVLTLLVRTGSVEWTREKLWPVRFVPLITGGAP